MRDFDFYEFVGILVPGSIVLFGIMAFFTDTRPFFDEGVFSVGELGLFAILAYVVGHLTQSIGNILEEYWWKLWGGWPTEWILSPDQKLLSDTQVAQLRDQLSIQLGKPMICSLSDYSHSQWRSIVREIYVTVNNADSSERVDIFNGNYSLFRGISVAGIALLIMSLIVSPHSGLIFALLTATALALSRMFRFGRYYARELYVVFIRLPVSESKQDETERT